MTSSVEEHQPLFRASGLPIALALLLAVGCGQGSSTAPGSRGPTGPTSAAEGTRPGEELAVAPQPVPLAPVVSKLRLTPLDRQVPNRNVRYRATASFVDRQGDVVGGTVEIVLNETSVVRGRLGAGPGTSLKSTVGTVLVIFFVRTFSPQDITGQLTVIDRAGHRSNTLGFVLRIRQVLRDGEERSPELSLRPPLAWIESATIRP